MPKLWDDITKNHETGHYVTLDLFKAVCFMTGIGLILFAAIAKFALVGLVIYFDFSARWINVDPPLTPGIVLVCLGMGAQAGKFLNNYVQRLTMDGGGHPLATAGSADAPPPIEPTLMPQPTVNASPTLPTEN